jgi:hypothetical protein
MQLLSLSSLLSSFSFSTLNFSRARKNQRDVNELSSATADGYFHATVPRVPHREMTPLPSS